MLVVAIAPSMMLRMPWIWAMVSVWGWYATPARDQHGYQKPAGLSAGLPGVGVRVWCLYPTQNPYPSTGWRVWSGIQTNSARKTRSTRFIALLAPLPHSEMGHSCSFSRVSTFIIHHHHLCPSNGHSHHLEISKQGNNRENGWSTPILPIRYVFPSYWPCYNIWLFCLVS